jgi:predicted PhzF superfamily epimerase YddE/YHI9
MNTPPPQLAAELPVAPVLLLHKVRAFTDQPQGGNPAGVICFAQFPPESKLQQLAQQAKQPVTAMLAPVEGGYQIRWFTPQQEINLCGHGTLAGAAVLFAQTPEMSQVAFFSGYGDIQVRKNAEGFSLCLPLFTLTPVVPDALPAAISQGKTVAAASGRDLILELASKQQVIDYQPDFNAIRQLPWHALLLTAVDDTAATPGYVLRYFAPSIGIDEDPATGSAHCSLLPYWQAKYPEWPGLWQAKQCSVQGGEFKVCRIGDQLELTSQAVVVATEWLAEAQLELPA